jgi:hypothetical protein
VSISTPQQAVDRTLTGLQTRTHDLVGRIRLALADHLFHTSPADVDSAAGLLSAAPTTVCVSLVELWHAAQAAGYSQVDLTARLGAEGRLIFEMVVGMYDTACMTPLPLLLESVGRLRDALS